jgi:hypothetical protein
MAWRYQPQELSDLIVKGSVDDQVTLNSCSGTGGRSAVCYR